MEELGIFGRFPEMTLGLELVLYGAAYELATWSVLYAWLEIGFDHL